MQNWQLWAVAAAISAAVTALLVKVGVQGVDAGMATLFRTLAVAIVLALVLLVSGRLDWQELRQLPALSLGALALSALATGVCVVVLLQPSPAAGARGWGGGARQAQCCADCPAGAAAAR